MTSARLAFATLAGSLLTFTGCASYDHECQSSGGWFQRFHLASHTTGAPCDCEGNGTMSMAPVPMTGDGTVIVPPNATLPPGAIVNPAPPVITAPPPLPGSSQPPRIVPIPQQQNPQLQAVPSPYNPPLQ